MKNKILLLIVFGIFIPIANAGGDATPMLVLSRNISMALDIEYVSEGRNLPASLGEMKLLREIVEQQPELANLANSMVVVPDCPIIAQQLGISRERVGRRLFAVSRSTNYDYAKKDGVDGRYTIWISENGNYSHASWLAETELQIILRQIGGFDPVSEPVAFPEAAEMLREQKRRDKIIQEKTREAYETETKRTVKNRSARESISTSTSTSHLAWWLFAGFGLLVFLALVVLKRIREK